MRKNIVHMILANIILAVHDKQMLLAWNDVMIINQCDGDDLYALELLQLKRIASASISKTRCYHQPNSHQNKHLYTNIIITMYQYLVSTIFIHT